MALGKILFATILLLSTFGADLLTSNVYAGAAEPVEPGILSIKLETEYKPKKKYRKRWIKGCSNLGRYLQAGGKGGWGTGIFNGYTCYDEDKIVAGEKKPGKARWLLLVRDETQTVTITMYHMAGSDGSKRIREAEVSFGGSPSTMEILADSEVAGLIALELADSMPFAGVMKIPSRKTKSITNTDKEKRSGRLMSPPKKYNLFTVRYDRGKDQWVPNLVGTAKLRGERKTFAPLNEDPAKVKKKKRKRKFKWKLKLAKQQIAKGKVYYFQNVKGRGKMQEEIHAYMDYLLGKWGLSENLLYKALFATLASGYGGIRYGTPLATGDPLVSKAAMVGAFAEVRGGPLEGLRWYWDFSPRTEVELSGETLHFEWSRPTLGWSIGMDIESGTISNYISRVDVVPKAGWWKLDSRLGIPSAASNGEEVTYVPQDFLVDEEWSFGIEFGIEKSTDWFLLRLWAASDGAGFIGDVTGTGSISSKRGGIDTYWDLFRMFDIFEFSLLAFAVGEQITLEGTQSSNEEAAKKTGQSLEGLSYNLAFAGFGLTLAW